MTLSVSRIAPNGSAFASQHTSSFLTVVHRWGPRVRTSSGPLLYRPLCSQWRSQPCQMIHEADPRGYDWRSHPFVRLPRAPTLLIECELTSVLDFLVPSRDKVPDSSCVSSSLRGAASLIRDLYWRTSTVHSSFPLKKFSQRIWSSTPSGFTSSLAFVTLLGFSPFWLEFRRSSALNFSSYRTRSSKWSPLANSS